MIGKNWALFILAACTFGIPFAAVAEPDCVAAIEAKLAAVKEYSCHISEHWDPGVTPPLAYEEDRKFRRPNLFAGRLEQTKHPIPGMVGAITQTYLDGATWWSYTETPAGGQDGRRPKPRVYKCDLAALRPVGMDEAAIHDAGRLIDPFRGCDRSTLALESETAEVWVLTAVPSADHRWDKNTRRVRLTIGKADGVLKEILLEGHPGESRITITDVRLNPGFAAGAFTFDPPDGVPVADQTETFLEK